MRNKTRVTLRIIPHICLGIASVIILVLALFISNQDIKNILIGVFANCIFFFVAYLSYDLIKQKIVRNEKKYLEGYIINKISNDVFVALYFLKKIIHGYNLDSNTVENIISIVNYSASDIFNSVKNQNYIGFQIFKNTDEVRNLFSQVLNDNFILKYSSHVDSINILRIANNLAELESILKSENNYDVSAESGIEFSVANGRDFNPENDERYLLLKKTAMPERFVVYDSGAFEEEKVGKLLKRYVLKVEPSKEVSKLLYETFILMKHWIPDVMHLARNETRFRIIKDFFSPNTNLKTKKTKIYVADILEK